MLPMASATMATRMMTIHRFQLPGCFGVFAWFPPDGGVFVPLGLVFVPLGFMTLELVTSVCAYPFGLCFLHRRTVRQTLPIVAWLPAVVR